MFILQNLLYKLTITLLILCSLSSDPKFYLTENESAIIIPQMYFDQIIYTSYEIQGSSFTIHEPVETVREYNKILSIAKNSRQESIIEISNTLSDVIFMFYITPDFNLKYATVKYETIVDIIDIPLQEKDIESLEIVSQSEVIIWGNRTFLKVTTNSTFDDTSRNYTYKILRLEMPTSLPFRINQCHYSYARSFICSTNQNIIQILQQLPSGNDDEGRLYISYILTPEQEITCIVNAYQLEQNLIALCDCKQGCFNFGIQSGIMILLYQQKMFGQQVLVMKMAESAPKSITMMVVTESELNLLTWGQTQIVFAEHMLLPEITGKDIDDASIVDDCIYLKYKVMANLITFEYVVLKYDNIRFIYDTLNVIMTGEYLLLMYRYLFLLTTNGTLILKQNNPFHIIVNYQSKNRLISINAVNTGSLTDIANQTINVQIISAIDGYVYIDENIGPSISINYQNSYPLELAQIFIGRVQKYVLNQRQVPIDEITRGTYSAGKEKQYKNFEFVGSSNVVHNFKDRKILSIFNILDCVKMESIDSESFKRYMSIPPSKIYVQKCQVQDEQTSGITGDFFCEFEQIIKSFSTPESIKKMDLMPSPFFTQGTQTKNKNSWKLIGLGSDTEGILIYEMWFRVISLQSTYFDGFQLVQFMFNTQYQNIHTIARRQSICVLCNRFIITATNSINKAGQGKKITICVYDIIGQKIQNKVKIPLDDYDYEGQENDIQGERISSVDCVLSRQDYYSIEYEITVGFQINEKDSLTIILVFVILKDYQSLGVLDQNPQTSLKLTQLLNLPQFSIYTRLYWNSLYSLNKTHISKYSMLDSASTLLYSLCLQSNASNSLSYVRNVGRYLLLVYLHSYRILDLKGELLTLTVDMQPYNSDIGNNGVYDIVIYNTDTILLGIRNVLRAYNRNLRLIIGPFPTRTGLIRTHHLLSISAIPANKAPSVESNLSLLISYSSQKIQIRGTSVKIIDNLPYSAINQTIMIDQDMFTGSIQQYYIADIYNGDIVLLNHIERVYDDEEGEGSMKRWLSNETLNHIRQNSYKITLQKHIDFPSNRQEVAAEQLVYCNCTHILIVSLKTKAITFQSEIPSKVGFSSEKQKCTNFLEFFMFNGSSFTMYTFFNTKDILYMNRTANTTTFSLFEVHKQSQFYLEQVSMTFTGSKLLLFVMMSQEKGKNKQINQYLGYVDILKNSLKIVPAHVTGVMFMATGDGLVFYAKLTLKEGSSIQNIIMCHQLITSILSNNMDQVCEDLDQVIPTIYYQSLEHYFKLVPYLHSASIIKFLLLSKTSKAFHVQLSFSQNGGKWETQNCYVSMKRFKGKKFIGMYKSQNNFDYFVLQHQEDDESKNHILAFYRYNRQFDKYCGEVTGWQETDQDQMAHMIHVQDPLYYPFINKHSYLFTTQDYFHLLKNISFVLNYESPPKNKYTVINARYDTTQSKFYSKLSYQPDPAMSKMWIYSSTGFSIIILFLLILKIISVLMDKGIIRWSTSLTSSDDDSGGSTGITVHFNSTMGGMITEDSSYKSLPSP